jgi:hypothetical protein
MKVTGSGVTRSSGDTAQLARTTQTVDEYASAVPPAPRSASSGTLRTTSKPGSNATVLRG